MRRRSLPRVAVMMAMLVAAMGAAASAQADGPPVSPGAVAPSVSFQQELDAMRADLATLRRAQGEQWLTEQRAAQIRGMVEGVLSDSSTRTAWAGGGAGLPTGYDPARGFFIGSADQGSSVRAFGFVQVAFSFNNGWGAAARDPAADNVWGADVRRAQLFVSGNIDGPDLTWLIGLSIGSWSDPVSLQLVQADPAAVDGSPPQISYLTVTKQLGNGLFVQAGSIFTPFNYESHLFSTAQTQMGECSMLEWLFTASFTTGVLVGRQSDDFLSSICFGDAIGASPSSWNSATNQSAAVSGRLNWRLAGTWEQYALETSFPGQPFGAFLGLAARFQNGRAINPATAGGANPRAVTADAAFMFGGANLIVQGIWAEQWTSPDDTCWGGLVQGGVFVAPAVEAFTSWAMADVIDIQSTLTAGANWYIDRQSLKLTGRVVVPVAGNPRNFTSAVLPPQSLGGGPNPNNNVSFVVQLQAEF